MESLPVVQRQDLWPGQAGCAAGHSVSDESDQRMHSNQGNQEVWSSTENVKVICIFTFLWLLQRRGRYEHASVAHASRDQSSIKYVTRRSSAPSLWLRTRPPCWGVLVLLLAGLLVLILVKIYEITPNLSKHKIIDRKLKDTYNIKLTKLHYKHPQIEPLKAKEKDLRRVISWVDCS